MGDASGNQPNDAYLRAVLRWSLQQQDSEGSGGVEPMSEERRTWLTEAMSQLQSAPSDVEIMKQQLEILKISESYSTEEERREHFRKAEIAIETLTELCDSVDNASDMIPLGGYPIIKSLLLCGEDALIWRAAELIATLAQNNPVCQMAVAESGLVSILLGLLRDSRSDDVRIKSIYAVSCVVKDHVEAHEAFLRHQGYSILAQCLDSEIEKVVVKTVFLMGNLCQSHRETGDALCEYGVVERLAAFMKREHAAWHEHVARTLLNLATEHSGCKKRCRRPEVGLEKATRCRLEFLLRHCGEEATEERDYCKQLLLLFR